MSVEIWIAFVLAATLLLIIPGPTITYVVATGLGQGRRAAFSAVPGVVLGDLVAMVVSLAGLGSLLAVSATLFTIVKWVGATYLIWLGWTMWRSASVQQETANIANSVNPAGKAFWVTVLNPKGLIFFVAFMPQFMSLEEAALPQFIILGSTFLVLAGVNAAAYAWLSGSAAALLTPIVKRRTQRAGASCLIFAGLATLLLDVQEQR